MALSLLVALAAWLARPRQIVFSNGSKLSIREVVFSRNAVYYHEPLRRLISRNRPIENGWKWLNLQFPGFAKQLRITSVNLKASGPTPALVVFGDVMIVPEGAGLEGAGFYEFVAIDREGRESAPLKTPVLNSYQSFAEDRPKIGPCILAMRRSLPGEPQFVRIYEVEKKSSTRRLLATLSVRIAQDAAGATFPIPPEEDELEPPQPAPDPSIARVVSVFPEDGAQGVATEAELKIRFDRPMNPQAFNLAWRAGGFLRNQHPRYDGERHEFTIPVTLEAGAAHQVAVNDNPFGGELRAREGFQDPEGRSADSYVWAFRTAPAGLASGRKKVKPVSVSPRSGSVVPLLMFIEISFGETMAAPKDAQPFLQMGDPSAAAMNGPAMISFVETDEGRRTFRIPLTFRPGKRASFAIHGFKTASGAAVDPISLEYEGSSQEFSPGFQAETERGARDPRLLELLGRVAEKRKELFSVEENIQSVTLGLNRGRFNSMRATGSRFIWEAPNRYFADVAETMQLPAFRLGSDGTNWWWHVHNDRRNRLVVCPVAELNQINASICDPFAGGPEGLRYEGMQGGLEVVSKWTVERMDPFVMASRTEWLIDPKSHRVAEVIQYHDGVVFRHRFEYKTVNSPLALESFLPPTMSSEPADPLDSDYTDRFVNIIDGSNGRMSVRWGKQGPKGNSSSGLN